MWPLRERMKPYVLLVGLAPHLSAQIEGLLLSSRFGETHEISRLSAPNEVEASLLDHEIALVICAETLRAQTSIAFLSRVRALHPRSIRILCVDQENPKALLGAVNSAEIYRFLCPPLDSSLVSEILEDAWIAARITAAQETMWSAAREVSRLASSLSARLTVSLDSLISSRFIEPEGREALRPPSDSFAEALQRLSAREGEIVEKLAAGRRVKDVALELAISTHTVRNHLKAIYRKLNVRSQLDLLSLMSRKPRKK